MNPSTSLAAVTDNASGRRLRRVSEPLGEVQYNGVIRDRSRDLILRQSLLRARSEVIFGVGNQIRERPTASGKRQATARQLVGVP